MAKKTTTSGRDRPLNRPLDRIRREYAAGHEDAPPAWGDLPSLVLAYAMARSIPALSPTGPELVMLARAAVGPEWPTCAADGCTLPIPPAVAAAAPDGQARCIVCRLIEEGMPIGPEGPAGPGGPGGPTASSDARGKGRGNGGRHR